VHLVQLDPSERFGSTHEFECSGYVVDIYGSNTAIHF
jgi:hypothetical protein